MGDTIVGRVKQVEGGRWKLDVNSRLDAELRLVNVQLPGGEQVRDVTNSLNGKYGYLFTND